MARPPGCRWDCKSRVSSRTLDVGRMARGLGGAPQSRPMANSAARDSKDGKLKGKKYRKELLELQAELCKLQEWVKYKGLKVVIIFEGRDGAGKGGTIKAITERVSPRVFRVVALP